MGVYKWEIGTVEKMILSLKCYAITIKCLNFLGQDK